MAQRLRPVARRDGRERTTRGGAGYSGAQRKAMVSVIEMWLLKNSLARNPPKFQRARRPYKRRSRFWWLGPFFQKRGFFNSHEMFQQLPIR
jgi:hypothetical protein